MAKRKIEGRSKDDPKFSILGALKASIPLTERRNTRARKILIGKDKFSLELVEIEVAIRHVWEILLLCC